MGLLVRFGNSWAFVALAALAGCDALSPVEDVAGRPQAIGAPPVNTLATMLTVNEDSPLFLDISVEDTDSATINVQLLVTNGVVVVGNGALTSGSGTNSVLVSGTPDQVNTALSSARFNPAPNFAGTASITMNASDPDGNVDLDILTITVTPFNDAPRNVVPTSAVGAVEDVPETFTTISVSDPDAATDDVEVTLTANVGSTMTLATLAGITMVTGDGDADVTMTFSGDLASVNSAMNGLTLVPAANYIGPSTIVVRTRDFGHNGTGVEGEDIDTVTIDWSAVNDAPVNVVPGAQSIDEEGSVTFSTANGNALSVSDVDANAAVLQATLSGTRGVLDLGAPGQVTFTAGDGSGDATMTFQGTLAQINAALQGTVFRAEADFTGEASVRLLVNDLNNSGSGGQRTDTDTVLVNVASFNDAPVVSSPSTQAATEDTIRVFSTALGNAISVADVDATGMQVTLTVTQGTLSLARTTGLVFSVGDGTSDSTMTFTGTVTAINTAINGLTYTPTANFSGAATLTVFASDLGSSGAGGVRTDTEVITINVSPLNDAPVATDDVATVGEDAGSIAIGVLANDTSGPDVGETLSVLSVATPLNGTAMIVAGSIVYTPAANFSGTDTFSYVLSDGNGGTDSGTITVTVTPENDPPSVGDDTYTVVVNSTSNVFTVLANDAVSPDSGESLSIASFTTPSNGILVQVGNRLEYTPSPAYLGPDSFTYVVSDGTGLTSTATVFITVVAANVPPTNALPVTQFIVEDTPLLFSATNAMSVVDPDSASMTVQVVSTNGRFRLSSTTMLTVTGNDTGSVTIVGDLARINTVLSTATFTPSTNFSGTATISLVTTDTMAAQDTDTLRVVVSAFNDPPVHTVPTTVSASEDVPEVFTTSSISDPDVANSELRVTLTANNGTRMSLSQTFGLTFTTGDGLYDDVLTFSGQLPQINAALNGLTVTPALNYIGSSTVVFFTEDLGANGAGVASSDTETVTINWAAVNDAPVNLAPASIDVLEDGVAAFEAATGTGLSLSDVDSVTSTMRVTLTATNGTLTVGNAALVTVTAGNAVGGTTVTLEGTRANLNQALEGTSFSPDANYNGAASLRFTTSDLGNSGSGGTKTHTVDIPINVLAVNDAPVFTVPSNVSTSEDLTFTLNAANSALVTVADVDATALQLTVSSTGGSFSLSRVTGLTFLVGDGVSDSSMTFNGTIANINSALNGMRFIPAANFEGAATIALFANDLGATGIGGALTATASVSVLVIPVNDAPTATADTVSVPEDSIAFPIDVLANDTYAPDLNDTLTVTTVSTPANGTASIVAGSVVFTPNADFVGNTSFTYIVTDSGGLTATAVASITVTPVNDPPRAVDDSITVGASTVDNVVDVLSNDTFAPDTGETLVVESVGAAANGSVTLVAGVVRYTPNVGYTGADAFTYTIGDGSGLTDTATVSVTVQLVDHLPVAVADTATTAEDTTVNVAVLTNDTGLEDAPLTVRILSQGTLGVATVTGNTVDFVPNPNVSGVDTWTYEVEDADGDRASATVTVTISAANDVPVAVADQFNLDEDTPTDLAVLANDAGASDLPVAVLVTSAPTHGQTTVLSNGSVRYVPTADYVGADAFSYTVTDGDGMSATATVSLQVAPVNDAPVAFADTASVAVGGTVDVDVLDNDTDVDDSTLTLVSVGSAMNGTVTISGGLARFTATAGFTGSATFTYVVSDAAGLQSTGTVTVGVGLDSDGDGLTDVDELAAGTDPQLRDSDADGIEDGVEVMVAALDPLDDDVDDDGLLDGTEDRNGDGVVQATESSPLLADTDGDGLSDGLESGRATPEGQDTDVARFTADADPTTQTNPLVADTDGGGADDGEEDVNGNGRIDVAETNPNNLFDDVPSGGTTEEGGCSCAVAGTSPRGPTRLHGLALAGLALAWAARRARRR